MEFKTESAERLKNEWDDSRLAPMVKTIVNDAAQYAHDKWNWDFLITSVHRTAAEDAALHASGIHVDWRAVDVRTNDRTQQEINDVAAYINEKYVYDAARAHLKVCFKEPHGNGVHAHFQVHPHTRLRQNNAAHTSAGTSSTANAGGSAAHQDSAASAASSGLDFRGTALPLDSDGLSEFTDALGVRAAELWAVLMVETRGSGFQPNRRPFILYERHIFSRLTGHRHDAAHSSISSRSPGNYGAGGNHQYERLQAAIALDREAALKSASWGIGQLMGFNAEISGYANVEEMVAAMQVSENEQLRGMVGEIIHNNLHRHLRNHNWAAFARGYNGSNFAINKYDTRLAAAFAKFNNGGLPDLTIRTAQVYLTYLGLNPGVIDGLPGRFTFSALNDFQQRNGLPLSNEIDDGLISQLKEKVSALA
jgi:hypothetical protein